MSIQIFICFLKELPKSSIFLSRSEAASSDCGSGSSGGQRSLSSLVSLQGGGGHLTASSPLDGDTSTLVDSSNLTDHTLSPDPHHPGDLNQVGQLCSLLTVQKDKDTLFSAKVGDPIYLTYMRVFVLWRKNW